SINSSKYHQLNSTEDRLSYLRALSINTLIKEAVEVFMNNEDQILDGSFDHALLEKCRYEAQINDIIKLSVDRIYNSHEVIEKEIAGYEIISQLLRSYTKAVERLHIGSPSNYDKVLVKSLPESTDLSGSDLYEKLLDICTFIASYSDRKAVLSFKKIRGFQLS
ncbi:MAG: dGTPase, partial [Bacteroidia bacterium]|nr:dGTPase [Bacteroidia bacterium]